MNNINYIKYGFRIILLCVALVFPSLDALAVTLRRPISAERPAWFIHIDTWNWADPQKIIDLIPADIRPYVVLNVSMSINHDGDASVLEFKNCPYGYETAKSWVRTCAENNMWVMVQPSSGGFCHFKNDDPVWEDFYKEYPNFVGWNFAEQFWGFDDKFSCTFLERLDLFTKLVKLGNQYGGYLCSSFCENIWSAPLTPVAMMKRHAEFAAACTKYPENFILCEKYTQASMLLDMESVCLGAWLSGYSGNYGIRYDQCTWAANHTGEDYPEAVGAIPIMEHIMLTGETIIDGPELIWQQDFRELNAVSVGEGYSSRAWACYPQFVNINIDMFRKILDKTVRIPTRKEIIDRTKVVILNNEISGSDLNKYNSPETLFSGLYLMDDDGTYGNQHNFFKKTGRYPAIPTVYQLNDADAKSFQVKVNKTDYASRWSTESAKIAEMNTLFPAEYSGDIFAGRIENGWMTYNPYMDQDQVATGKIPFKYNTCNSIELSYARYSMGVIKEFSDHLDIYLTNYRVNSSLAEEDLVEDIVKIYGCSSEPIFTYTDRASHRASLVTKTWSDNVLTLSVKHNGPLDITIHCAGSATDRLSEYTEATLIQPANPAVYAGPRQYEAENFDYKYIDRIYSNGYGSGRTMYTALGYLSFGKNAAAAVRDTISVLNTGNYLVEVRYMAPDCDINSIDLYANGVLVSTPTFAKTSSTSEWKTIQQKMILNAGKNVIEMKANTASAGTMFLDNMVVTEVETDGIFPTLDVASGMIPRGWITYATDPGIRGAGSGYYQGPRVMDFVGDFTKGLYFRATDEMGGYASYGEDPYTPLSLSSGTYTVEYNLIAWKDASVGSTVKFTVSTEDGTIVATRISTPSSNLDGAAGRTVSGSNSESVDFIVSSSANYILKWEILSEGGWVEIVLGNVCLKGSTTNIDDIINNYSFDKGIIYDIFGREIKSMDKGSIYIINGKKVLYQ